MAASSDIRFALAAAQLGLLGPDQLADVIAGSADGGDRPSLAHRLVADGLISDAQRQQVEAQLDAGTSTDGTLLEIAASDTAHLLPGANDMGADGTLLAMGPDSDSAYHPPPPGTSVATAGPAPGTGTRAVELRRSGDRYDVAHEIARGGQARIMLALDKDIEREVAMKVLATRGTAVGSKPGSHGGSRTSPFLGRFLDEARLTARLEHPNIVPVHEIGERADGDAYYTMKLVRGRSLANVLRELRKGVPATIAEWPLPRLVRIFQGICQAVAFAHQHGVIHRDLKPDNVMVGDFGEVYVIDWGLAKDIGATSGQSLTARIRKDQQAGPIDTSAPASASTVTATGSTDLLRGQTLDGSIIGTPQYMPPEQAEGRIAEVDRRADVYSLGAILYEILTLHPPYEGDTIGSVLSQVIHGVLVEPADRAPKRRPPDDLSAIAVKCLARRADDRYADAVAVLADVELHLSGFTVSAQQATLLLQLVKLIRRNKAVAATMAVALLLMAAGVALYLVNITRARDLAAESARLARDESGKARAAEERALTEATNAQAATARATRDAERARQAEAVSRRNLAGAYRMASEAARARGDLTATMLLVARALELHDTPDLRARLLDPLPTMPLLHEVAEHNETITEASMLPGDRILVVVSCKDRRNAVRVRDARTGRLISSARLDGELIFIEPDANGDCLVAMVGPDLHVIDTATGRDVLSRKAPENAPIATGRIDAAGTRLLTADGPVVEVRSLPSCDVVRRLEGHTAEVMFADFSPDGRWIASCSTDGKTLLWDAATGRLEHTFEGDKPLVVALFSPDGTHLMTIDQRMTSTLWSVATRRPVMTTRGLPVAANGLRRLYPVVGINGSAVVSGTPGSRSISLYTPPPPGDAGPDGPSGVERQRFEPAEGDADTALRLNHDGSVLAVRVVDGSARLIDMTTFTDIASLRLPTALRLLEFSPDGRFVATSGADRTAQVWTVGGRLLASLTSNSEVHTLQFSADGTRLLVADESRVRVLGVPDIDRNWLRHRYVARNAVLSGDGRRMVHVASEATTLSLIDTATGAATGDWRREVADLSATMLAGGRMLLIESGELVDPADPSRAPMQLLTAAGDRAQVADVDGRFIAVSHERSIELVDALEFRRVATIPFDARDRPDHVALIGPDLSVLVVVTESAIMHLLAARTGASLQPPVRVRTADTRPGSSWLVYATDPDEVRAQHLPVDPGGPGGPGQAAVRVCSRGDGIATSGRVIFGRGPASAVVFVCGDPRSRMKDLATGATTTWDWPDEGEPNVAFTEDGRYVVAVTRSATRLIDVATGEVRHTLQQHHAQFCGAFIERRAIGLVATPPVRFAPDGSSFLVSHDNDESRAVGVDCVDMLTGEVRFALPINGMAFVQVAAYSPDGTQVALAYGRVVIVFDAASGHEVRRLELDAPMEDADLTDDWSRLLVRYGDNRVEIRDMATFEPVATLPAERAQFSVDGTRLKISRKHRTLAVTDLESDRVLRRLDFNGLSSAFSTGTLVMDRGGHNLLQADSGTLRVFPLDDGNGEARVLSVPAGRVRWAAISADGARVFAEVGADMVLLDATVPGGRIMGRLGVDAPIADMVFTPDSAYVATATRVLDVVSGREVCVFDTGGQRTGFVNADRVAVLIDDRTIRLVDLRDSSSVLTLDVPPPDQPGGYRDECELYVGRGRVAAVRTDDSVVVWDGTTGERLFVAHVDFTPATLAFAPDGPQMVVAGYEDLAVFDATSGERLMRATNSTSGAISGAPLNRAQLIGDGRRVLVGGYQDVRTITWAADAADVVIRLRLDSGRSEDQLVVQPEPLLAFPRLDPSEPGDDWPRREDSRDPVAEWLAADPAAPALQAARNRLNASGVLDDWRDGYPTAAQVARTRDLVLHDPDPPCCWLALYDAFAAMPRANGRRLLVQEALEAVPANDAPPLLQLVLAAARVGGRTLADPHAGNDTRLTLAERAAALPASDAHRGLIDALRELAPRRDD
ncbi:MAG: WD40 repeat domain-containing serine/threonine protein kinase [Planctomycetota bacterium]